MLKKIKTFLFLNRGLRQTIAKNSFWLFFGEIVGRFLRAVVVIYAARVLGAAGWGAFSYAMTLAAFFTLFSDLGMGPVLTREASKHLELRAKYLSTSFLIKSVLLIISIGAIIFVAPRFNKIELVNPLLPFVALILTFDGLREFGLSLNRALEKMEWEAFIKIITGLSIAVFGVFALAIFTSIRSLTLAYALGSAAGFFFTVWILRNYFKNLFSGFSKNLLWPIFSSAWPIALLGLLGAIMINTDIIMLGWFRTPEEIGFYSAAQRPIQLLYIFPTFLATSAFPVFARLARKDDAKCRRVLEKLIGVVFMVGLPLVSGGIILGKEIMLLLFGADYLPAVLSFKILILTILVVFPTIIISNVVFAYNEQKRFIIVVALGALGNVALNYMLIPRYGIEGSAAATILAQLFANSAVWLKLRQINRFSLLPHLKNIIPATVLMTLITFLLHYTEANIFINISTSALLYLALLFILKEPLLKELRNLAY